MIMLQLLMIISLFPSNILEDNNINFFKRENTKIEKVVDIPENIEYMEYCYNSWQCEVPNKYKKIVEKRILNVKRGIKND